MVDSTDPTVLSYQAAAAGRVARHFHASADVNGVGAHTHVEGDVTSLVTDLAGKAASTHTHAESDVTNLATDLAAKPNGTIGTWRQSGALTTISASVTETAIASGVGSFTLVSGRRYKFTCVHFGQVTTAQSSTGRIIFRLRLGAGIAGTELAESAYSLNTSIQSITVVNQGLCGTDFAAGATSLSLTGTFSVSNTWTPLGVQATYPPNTFILVEDIGT